MLYVTENGVVPGVKFLHQPYPHVAVGDSRLSSADYRRVAVAKDLADRAADGTITVCSIVADMKRQANRRSS